MASTVPIQPVKKPHKGSTGPTARPARAVVPAAVQAPKVSIKPATGDKSSGDKINVGGHTPTPIENTVQRDPYVKDIQGKINNYVEGTPEYAGALTDKALGGIRDSFEGVTKGIDAAAAARGIGGTGAHGLLMRRSGDDQRRALSSAAKDISLGQHANVGEMLGTAGSLALGAQSGMQNQQRIGLETRALANAENQQSFDQLRALSGIYNEETNKNSYADHVTEDDAAAIKDAQTAAAPAAVSGSRSGHMKTAGSAGIPLSSVQSYLTQKSSAWR